MLDYQQGDAHAFEALYSKHKGPLYRYFVRQISDNTLAEDLYQDTWGKVINAADNYQVTAKFTTWLYRIAHNLLIDHVRAVKPLDKLDELGEQGMDEFDASIGNQQFNGRPDEVLEQQHQAQLLKACVAKLPAVQKEAFLLNIELGLTANAISDIANVTVEATKSRIRYAYQSIKQCVANKWEGMTHE
ncbi:RNA polymerase subunit sigma-24 [Shewanella sp. UCD-FRSSP16_17]|uniref:sigma-70 family RNA polymerase sigma factor n=1 Tax=unclassified Shewanella TaxID=196818 RepID=UPI0007EEE8E5|nr:MULTISPECIES: sigma-70 family RNA polymerase sigma factor [unclassified Shewanella]MBQ4889967.1 sigma-70 family RNA polymerase sigma factor [Shewanella sp. MMG014]OBT10700.1 RNA polymerase subunit sigma-24 [Shewanella sp. UCD-FRSSP16_17]